MEEERFGEYGKILCQGVAKSPLSVGKAYFLFLEDKSLINISRHFEDGFRFVQYKILDGEFTPCSEGRVGSTNWRNFLEEKL